MTVTQLSSHRLGRRRQGHWESTRCLVTSEPIPSYARPRLQTNTKRDLCVPGVSSVLIPPLRGDFFPCSDLAALPLPGDARRAGVPRAPVPRAAVPRAATGRRRRTAQRRCPRLTLARGRPHTIGAHCFPRPCSTTPLGKPRAPGLNRGGHVSPPPSLGGRQGARSWPSLGQVKKADSWL